MQGLPGERGVNGIPGLNGPPGEVGLPGDAGPRGPTGTRVRCNNESINRPNNTYIFRYNIIIIVERVRCNCVIRHRVGVGESK